MSLKLISYTIVFLLLSIVFLKPVEAGGDRTSPRLIGMARTGGAVARGLDAVVVNPALLSLPHRANVEISVASAGVYFGSNFLDYKFYNTYFTGVDDPVTGERVAKHLSPQDKQDILDVFPGGNGKIHAEAKVLWLGLSIRGNKMGGLAFTVSDRFSATLSMPNDYVRMLLEGFSEFGSTYNFSGTHAESWWVREYTASYATPRIRLIKFLPWVTLGANIKRVDGYAYFGTESLNGYISNRGFEDGFMMAGEMNMITRRASANFIYDPGMYDFDPIGIPAGTGWGFDFGIAAGISQAVTIGLSVTDMGSIHWTENTYGSSGSATVEIDDLFSREQQDSLRNAYAGNEEAIGAFTTSLPMAVRAGISWRLNRKLILAADYTQRLNVPSDNRSVPRAAAGLEWRPFEFLPIRSGVAAGGLDGFSWAFGFGFNIIVFDIEVATENIGLLLYPDISKHASITVGTKFRF